MSDQLALFQRIPLLANLSPQQIGAILSSCAKTAAYQANEVIFQAGDQGREIYLIPKGRIRVEIGDQSLGRENHIFTIQGPEVFGEIAFLDDAPRSATARAEENISLLVLNKDPLNDFLRANTDVGFAMMHNFAALLAQRVRNTNQAVLDEVRQRHEINSKAGHLASRRYREVVNNFTHHMRI